MEPDFYYRQLHAEVHASNSVSANFKDRKKKITSTWEKSIMTKLYRKCRKNENAIYIIFSSQK